MTRELRAVPGPEVLAITADVTSDQDRRRLLDTACERLGGLDVLVNNAGVASFGHFTASSEEVLRQVMEVNFFAPAELTRLAIPILTQGSEPAVVNVASQAALVSLPQQAAYTAAKGAVAALTRSLAIDWAEHGVRVNAVAPGFTRTPMTEEFFENTTFVEAATRRIPLGRLLEAREVAGAIVLLASPLASAVTGVVLPVDGGWTAGEPALPWS